MTAATAGALFARELSWGGALSLKCHLAALAVAFAAAGVAHASCKLSIGADLPLVPDPARALVKGAVNDKPVVFIVDTGAWMSSMTYPDAQRLGVKMDNVAAITSEGIGGTVATTEGRFDMRLGSIDLPHEMMTVLAMQPLDHDAAALVGLDLLAQYDLELNLPANDIKIVKVEGCMPSDLQYWTPGKPVNQTPLENDGSDRPAILVNVLLNGHLVPAQLDSGSPHSIVTPAAARLAGADPGKGDTVEAIGGVGAHRIGASVVRFDTFTIGGETIRNANIIVSDMWKYNKVEETATRLGSHTYGQSAPRMLLGADFLRAHRVLIAKRMRLMAFSYMGGPVFDVSSAQSSDGRDGRGQSGRSQQAPTTAPAH